MGKESEDIKQLKQRVSALEEMLQGLISESQGFMSISRAASILNCSSEAIRSQIRESERQRVNQQKPRLELNYHYRYKGRPDAYRPTWEIHLQRFQQLSRDSPSFYKVGRDSEVD